jgi:hypothetical protein
MDQLESLRKELEEVIASGDNVKQFATLEKVDEVISNLIYEIFDKNALKHVFRNVTNSYPQNQHAVSVPELEHMLYGSYIGDGSQGIAERGRIRRQIERAQGDGIKCSCRWLEHDKYYNGELVYCERCT